MTMTLFLRKDVILTKEFFLKYENTLKQTAQILMTVKDADLSTVPCSF